MKKIILSILFLAVSFITFAQKTSTISGVWEGRANEVSLFHVKTPGQLEKLANYFIQDDRKFFFTFSPEKEGYYMIGFGEAIQGPRNKHIFYFKPGDQLNLVVNDSTYVLVGKNTKENQAMAAWHNYIQPLKNIYGMSNNQTYVTYFPLLDEKIANPYKAAKTGNKIFDESFVKYRKYDMLLYAIDFLLQPNSAYPEDEDFTDYYRVLRFSDLTATADILTYPYAIRILSGVSAVEFLMKVSPPLRMNDRLETVKNDTVRGELVLFILNEGRRDSLEHQAFKEKNEHYIVIPEQQQRFETQFKQIEARIAYENSLQRWNATQARARMPVDTVERKGTPAPNFTYNDVNDNPVSLSDFKGKLIYLDVWGTWCGPCLAQKPSLKKLKGQFEDNDDIVFISISGERSVNDVQKWKDFVEKEQLPGVHLFGRTTGDDDIANLYKISGYPTFFIIGKDGNFISTNAPRPTSDALEGILRRLLAEK